MPNLEENNEHIEKEAEPATPAVAPLSDETAPKAPAEEKVEAPSEKKADAPVAPAEEKAEAPSEKKTDAPVAEEVPLEQLVPELQVKSAPYYARYTPQPSEEEAKLEKQKKAAKRARNTVIAVLLAVVLLSSSLLGGFALGRLNTPILGGTTEPSGGGDNSQPSVDRGDLILNVIERVEGTPEPGTAAGVAAAVGDSVVNIEVIITMIDPYSGSTQYTSGGSGVLISAGNAKGLILTSNHIINDADAGGIAITLADGRTYTGNQVEVLGTDPVSDTALLQIKEKNGSAPANLTYATLATSGAAGDYSYMALGETVVVIGNPLGVLPGSVTVGAVSGHGREIIVDDMTLTLTQIDAPINQGNSGGGVFNMAGELVGIVTARSAVASAQDIGYISPSCDLIPIIGELYTQGYVSGRPYLGLYFNISSGYFVVVSYEYNDELPFGKSLQAGDYITYVDGEILDSTTTLRRILYRKAVGDYITLTVARLTGGQFVTFDVSLRVHEYTP